MPVQTSRTHLLAIDDDAAVREVYEDLFADAGFEVTVAPSVTVADVRSIRPDLVLLDWSYPWNEPPALLRAMRQSTDLATMPTIVATTSSGRAASTLPEDRYTRLAPKPFTLEEILDLADFLLAQARDLTRRSHAMRQQPGRALDHQDAAGDPRSPAQNVDSA